MNTFLDKKIKILIVLLAAFLISKISLDNLFIARSPKVNPLFVSNTIAKINSLWSKTGDFIASLNFFPRLTSFGDSQNNEQPGKVTLSRDQIDRILKTPLKQVSKGVYAGETEGIQVYEVRINEFDYLEYIFNVDGKEIKIRVPEGQAPPTQKVIEQLYQ